MNIRKMPLGINHKEGPLGHDNTESHILSQVSSPEKAILDTNFKRLPWV